GSDFYAAPRLSPDGTRLAWLTWEHPNMPWDETALWVAEVLADGTLGEPQLVAGGEDESIYQPAWSPAGVLHFVSDRTGWWNLYRWREGQVEPLRELAAEFGEPQWVFGMSTYDFVGPENIITTYTQDGSWHVARLESESEEWQPLEIPYTSLISPQVGPLGVALRVGAPAQAAAIALFDLEMKEHQVLRSSSAVEVSSDYLTVPKPVEFPTTAGLTAHGLFYAPQNVDHVAPEGELPPLLVFIHGGPTAAASSSLSLKLQYWTSRGFAVLDVNCGGSTGYGRAYRERLNGQWGVVDVDDCVNGARYLVERGLVDGERLAIRGGSAGGYTTLCALTFHELFKAGASYYGIGDLEALAQDTHKFESRCLDRLVGPYPERKDIYEERSPLHFTEQLSCPVIFFQGLEDQVVPPCQAEQMVAALESKGVPVAYLPFEGEQHGFRRAENIKRALDAELYFYSRVFDFPLAEPVEPVAIKNL
ncbi:MAG: prolyl oligopeptidase family serine peptidase, partial [Anaerolineae bacterium]|nr:prolyl oligopeptidase family serine peptidase [Anaerolineae bacterium]